MYPEPHFPAEEHARATDEIRTYGFLPDPLLERIDTPVLGLNVAVHWPLPDAFRDAYESLRGALSGLDPGVHVYPFAKTHVTLVTLVSFKRHERPGADEAARLYARLPELRAALDAATADLGAFQIDVGAPVLVRTAAFLPILNPGGEIARIRSRIAALRDRVPELSDLRVPAAIHSTIARFRCAPARPATFIKAFHEAAQSVTFGVTRVDEILLTTETQPYMMAGAIEHRSRLAHRSNT
jgi:hypothetical protein